MPIRAIETLGFAGHLFVTRLVTEDMPIVLFYMPPSGDLQFFVSVAVHAAGGQRVTV